MGRRVTRIAAVIGSALLVLALAACDAGAAQVAAPASTRPALPALTSLTPVEDPRAVEGPSTVVIGGPALPPIVAPAPQLPVTVRSADGGGREVTVRDTSRIVALSLSGTVAELVHALGLGDHLVGRDVSTNLPETATLPVVTKKGHTIDAEAVLALKPTLILTDGSIGPTDVVLQLGDAGIPVVTIDRATDAESTYRAIDQVAAALGIAPAAETVNTALRAAMESKTAEIARLLPADPSRRPRVVFLYVRGAAGVYYLFGKGSGADSLISSVGAVDAASEAGWVGERPLTPEALVKIDPDVILVMTKGLESAGGIDGLLAAQPSIALTTAGEHRRIIDAEDTRIFAAGTLLPDIMDGLARALYAPDSGAPG
ncbi:Hemin-binding periplasmic protein HmuT precursor [Microbacterium azadirachtae]|uniref:Hemin-binding periplasmic protein HmuT n=1 Tax=Microbacterium azadirachtae TaxID=582680 RepID=A0A0F0LGF8_9MICO|nr:Hemin-binding periplasmic protein HmuT precursor [Microbacterium azadirachtae]